MVIPACSLASLLLIAWFDVLTGFEYTFSLFYLIPIILSAIFGQPFLSYCTALLAAGAWTSSELISGKEYTHQLALLWNAFIREVFLLVFSLLLVWLVRSMRLLSELSNIDSLTSLPNRRYFWEQADRMLAFLNRQHGKGCIAYIDLDNFKQVNDLYGHQAGDEVLKLTAITIRNNIRPYDIAGRMGGDEFAIFMADVDASISEAALNKVKQAFDQKMKSMNLPVRMSIGTDYVDDNHRDLADLLARADASMYAIKRSHKSGS